MTVPSPRIDPEVEDIIKSTLPSGAAGVVGATASDESRDSRLEEVLLLSEEAQQELVVVQGDCLPASSKRVESPQLPIDPAVHQELAVSSTNSTTIIQVQNSLSFLFFFWFLFFRSLFNCN